MTIKYISCDIETDGPIPGDNSMLAVGAAVFEMGKEEPLDTFYATLLPLDGAHRDKKTMEWWAQFPNKWKELADGAMKPGLVMDGFHRWLEAHKIGGHELVFIGWPATFDFMFTHWYLMHFVGDDPFSHAGMDIKTCVSLVTGIPFRWVSKKKLPREWLKDVPGHNHNALQDAVGQGMIFIRMLKDMEWKDK